ncbi:DHA2 family efflux MFS transporter permease subunit [Clostridium sp. P21]|uniref:DHA2 family efflux MFS transporter permease subunit n=1 Tax=Clostridium muellerianum TaxID=2716538 RepID=A0A7Y0HNT3_9CLOT|nr:DHA2 family efflux MFS transporter permease subunit [Clostridium muellerianum]NMM62987.1 DHA2 family efflux MFS transporter permease subunit [Clostridium muellerianum]
MEEKEAASYKWLCLMVIIIGTFMAFLDTSIVNIALPKIMSVFSTSLDTGQWVLTGYMLAAGAVIPLTGYLEEVLGYKKVYIFAIVVFTIGSFLCGVSWSIDVLILARILQAIGGGMIMPVGMSTLYKVIPKEKIGLAAGIYGISIMVAPAIGPTLGGYIVQYLSWNLIFNINVPIGIIGTILAIAILKEDVKKVDKKLDFIGVLTSTLGLISILYVVSEWSKIDWGDIKYPLLIVFGCFNLAIFIFNEFTIENPLLELRVLKILPYSVNTILINIIVFAMYGVLVFIPLFLQNLSGLNAMQSGIIMLYYAIGSGITMPIAGKMSDKIGGKPFIIVGIVLMIISTYELYFLSTDMSNSTLKFLLFIRGASVGLCMMPATTMSMAQVPPELISRASALQNTVKQVAGSLSTTILTVFLQNRKSLHYYRLAEQLTPFNPVTSNFTNTVQSYILQKGTAVANAKTGVLYLAYKYVYAESYMKAIDDVFMLTLIVVAATIPLMFIGIRKKQINKM